MTLYWPATLPRPSRNAYGAQPQDARQRRAAESGPPGYRRRFSSAARNVGLSLSLSRAEKGTFDTFFYETTARGSLPFWMTDPTTDGWAMLTGTGAPVLDDSGTPLLLSAQWLCLFGDNIPSETMRGVTFIIAFNVWVMP